MVASVVKQLVTLICGSNVRSNPLSTIQWRDNNGTVLSAGGRYVFGNTSDSIYLNISNTALSDKGNWTCVLNNGLHASRMVNVLLIIIGEPYCSIHMHLKCNSSISITVSAYENHI